MASRRKGFGPGFFRRLARRARRGRAADEAGMSTVEVVIGTPVLFLFVVAMIQLGFYAQNTAQVQDAAQDAARMGSLQRTPDAAKAFATNVADDDLGSLCSGGSPVVSPPTTSVDSADATLLTVTVACTVTEFGLTYTIQESSYAPVDTYFGGQP
jgi:Flp pilus assembly protein TadG